MADTSSTSGKGTSQRMQEGKANAGRVKTPRTPRKPGAKKTTGSTGTAGAGK